MQDLYKNIEKALEYRQELIEKLHSEDTDAYRLFHGISEGREGLTIDRYGNSILLQTFREPLPPEEYKELKNKLDDLLRDYVSNEEYLFVYNHRGMKDGTEFETPAPEAYETRTFKELGLKYIFKGKHRGQDPLLFLDMRAGRRFILQNSKGLSMLNLFSYTSGSGVAAIAGGAKEVCNVDFAASSLETGRQNHELNSQTGDNIIHLKSDVFSAVKQLAGIPLKSRDYKLKPDVVLKQKSFDLVFLDPPAWAKSKYGTVDLVRDYQSVFKPALLATSQGGKIIAVNNSAKVNIDEWLDILKRCAAKAGREINEIEVIRPEADFPSWDGKPPLKIAVCSV